MKGCLGKGALNVNNYKNILKEIALNPITYRKLHDEYNGGLPSDSTLKLKLLREYGFNAGKIDGFLKDFRRTLTIAGLSDKEEVTDMKHNNNYQKEYHEKTQEITPETQNKILQISRKGESFPIPFLKGNKATIVFDRLPVMQKDLDKLKRWIDLFGESLIEYENE